MNWIIGYVSYLALFYVWTEYQLKAASSDRELWSEELE